jgi:hypothetical protein
MIRNHQHRCFRFQFYLLFIWDMETQCGRFKLQKVISLIIFGGGLIYRSFIILIVLLKDIKLDIGMQYESVTMYDVDLHTCM